MSADAAKTLEEQVRRMTPIAAPAEQRADVVALFELLDRAGHLRKHRGVCQLVGPDGESIAIPERVFYVRERVAEVMARGDSVTVVPVGQELTTQQAADMLNVSRQYLVRLLEDDRIPYRRTGRHRRLRIDDVLAFQAERDRDRQGVLAELSALSQEFGGYDELK